MSITIPEDVLAFTREDFEKNTEAVWAKLEELSFAQLFSIQSRWDTEDDESIQQEINEIIYEKVGTVITEVTRQAFSSPDDWDAGSTFILNNDSNWVYDRMREGIEKEPDQPKRQQVSSLGVSSLTLNPEALLEIIQLATKKKGDFSILLGLDGSLLARPVGDYFVNEIPLVTIRTKKKKKSFSAHGPLLPLFYDELVDVFSQLGFSVSG